MLVQQDSLYLDPNMQIKFQFNVYVYVFYNILKTLPKMSPKIAGLGVSAAIGSQCRVTKF